MGRPPPRKARRRPSISLPNAGPRLVQAPPGAGRRTHPVAARAASLGALISFFRAWLCGGKAGRRHACLGIARGAARRMEPQSEACGKARGGGRGSNGGVRLSYLDATMRALSLGAGGGGAARPPMPMGRGSWPDAGGAGVLAPVGQGGPPTSYRRLLSPREEGETFRDLRLLRGAAWINDEVVNLYMQLVQQRAAPPGGLHIFSSFFWTKLACTPAGYGYAGVRRWTKKVDVFAASLLLVPINIGNSHWALVAVHVPGKRIEYYDSLHRPGKKVMKIILRYLVDEAADKGRTPVEPGEWKMRAVAEGVPRQEDGGSCGVFMCAYAERLAAGHGPPFMFSGRHVANLRKGMVLDLLRLKLHGGAGGE